MKRSSCACARELADLRRVLHYMYVHDVWIEGAGSFQHEARLTIRTPLFPAAPGATRMTELVASMVETARRFEGAKRRRPRKALREPVAAPGGG
jgi:hypothetical protein